MKRRNPRYIAGLEARLERLWSLRQPSRVPSGPGRWPVLSAEALWRFQYAGLRHLIRRGDSLGELWLTALERAAKTVRGMDPRDGERAEKLEKVINGFSQRQLGPGQLKAGTDWEPIERQVQQITWEFEQFLAKVPHWARLAKEQRDARLTRFARALFRRVELTQQQVNNLAVALHRGSRPAAVVLVAVNRRADPDQMRDSLRKWNKENSSSGPRRNQDAASVRR